MPSLATLHLDQLRCIVESDATGGSEPYLWVTYFAVDGRNLFQQEPVMTVTPVYDGFRREFPDNISDGQRIDVPSFLASCSFELDPGPFDFMLAGIVAVLLEEDETPDKAIRAGRNAFLSEIHEELNSLIRERIVTQNRAPVSPEEVEAIGNSIKPAVESAIRSNLTWRQKLFGDQDDVFGFGHVAFIGDDLRTRDFEFPEIVEKGGRNRFVLNGNVTVGPVPTVVDLCARQRAAVQAKKQEIQGLQTMRAILQQQLHTATPQQKAAIVRQIEETGEKLTRAESELLPLEVSLQACQDRFGRDVVGGSEPIVVG